MDAEAASFKKQTTPNVVVTAEALRGLNISLQPGLAQENVTVVASAEGLQNDNHTFLTQNGDFPGGGTSFFTLTRRVLRVLGATHSVAHATVFNVFNTLNLSLFTFNTPSTVVQNQFFGTAGTTPALAGRVLELQARVSV